MRIASILLIIVVTFILLSSALTIPALCQSPTLINPATIPQWVNQLEGPPTVFVPTNITDNSGKLVRQDYTVKISQFTQQILPLTDANGNPTGFPATTVWGYEGDAENAVTGQNLGIVKSTPGSTFEATQGIPIQVKWVNNLVDAQGKPLPHLFAVDPTVHWANPKNLTMSMTSTTVPPFPPGYTDSQSPVPIVEHLHGGEDPSASDGNPDSWYTADGLHGPAYNTVSPTDANAAIFAYPNEQPPTTLWYHDHTLGLTRLNVMAGLAGFYIINNASDPIAKLLPSGEYDVPLVIQDRSFLADGSLYVSSKGSNPSIHPYWTASSLGNTLMINGKVWPNMNVKQGQYRFRILDGSGDRFYNISLSNGMTFTQIGTDGGYLKSPVNLTSLMIAPAERADILVDFSNIPAGEKIILNNKYVASTDPAQIGQVIQFTVTSGKGSTPQSLPSQLNPTLAGSFPSLPAPETQRTLTLTYVGEQSNPTEMLLDGQAWDAPVSEKPELGTTEDWIIVNPTMDAHPIHIHLIQFQLVKRQALDGTSYMQDWLALNGQPPLSSPTKNVASLNPYLIGSPTLPTPNEQGWKDTITVYPGEMVTVRMRFAQQDGASYKFDATAGPGYVWHCHLLSHEDNSMMRPYVVVAPGLGGLIWIILIVLAVVIALIVGFLVYRRRRRREKVSASQKV